MYPVMGGSVATLCGCHGLPRGSSAAATMLCVLCNHESARKVVLTLSIKQPISHRDWGVPVSSHLRRALCRATMCLRGDAGQGHLVWVFVSEEEVKDSAHGECAT